jgi:magnesium transporter
MKLIGCISLKDLIIGSPQDSIETILKTDFVYATVDETKEEAAKKIEHHNLIALPILNNKNQIVGILTYDDAINIIRTEQSEDTDLLVGITSEENAPDYLRTPSIRHLRKRIKWIVIVFMGSIFNQIFLHNKNAFFLSCNLILYIGMITDTGGNVGSQVASVVLQALNRGQVTLADWCRIIFKEIEIALMISSILFVLTFVKIFLVSIIEPDAVRNYHVMFIVALSVVFQIICSAFIGATLPLAAKYLKGDPAVAANPVINTTVELLGTMIYYAVIYWLLNPASSQSQH